MRTTKPAADQTDELSAWATQLTWHDAPESVRRRLSLVLLDTLAVTLAGARTEGQRRLRSAWPQPPGDAPVFGGGSLTHTDTAAYLNATALVSCELDEGGKYAKGHPAGHTFPAILTLAASLGATGEQTARALLAGYEVAARFGRATALRPGVHPHGNWGVTGAAAGCALLLGLPAPRVAAAVDTACGLPVAGHFDSALDGHRVRDAWMGTAAHSGLAAARLAAAGVVQNTGTAALTYGTLLGDFDPVALTRGLGADWQIEHNYFKRHASCSYTHPAADLALELRERDLGGDRLCDLPSAQLADRIAGVTVETHALAAPLDGTHWDSALAAMFSVPYAVAAALLHGRVAPATAEATGRARQELLALARKVTVSEDPALTAHLPHERPARLTAVLDDGRSVRLYAPNPVGDTDHRPFTPRTLPLVLADVLGDTGLVDRLEHLAGTLPDTADVGPPLRALAAADTRETTTSGGAGGTA
ncbi:MmgE/PrpD family protein [Streptomyces tubbatahanensis]|uniref:MmgE/PrpD family protein n=1 Tax=Streptomyces tubbatahanensis TaxID=2923272 RepID=A0ABY3Y2D5_9ACTN|nr:MmgE/PrpD family protein [Streptomyces tubbatahanensis]UNT00683.1 MmgE/PrpD family protein [Streptomyces tubbatahanensis]